MEFKKGDKVKAFQGDYAGYYGEIIEFNDGVARVSHEPWEGGFAGFDIQLTDLEPNE